MPYYFELWSGKEYIHVKDINDGWSDFQGWEYAKQKDLVIVSKDADFSDMILLNEPPPRVVHIKLDNMKMNEFYASINKVWDQACKLCGEHKLIRIFKDRIECIN